MQITSYLINVAFFEQSTLNVCPLPTTILNTITTNEHCEHNWNDSQNMNLLQKIVKCHTYSPYYDLQHSFLYK